ncbi:putative peptidylglycine alpha-hydroxylating monooxygenase 1 isoform X3 [Clavelina lepadiformis]|uniref:putative peptidylglycine alpha-hydroxylating monooxygenase 1 isoform X3 n=1 Tax=Clavelina lepadiformis TaxID=159417 RepID=UPI00404180D3
MNYYLLMALIQIGVIFLLNVAMCLATNQYFPGLVGNFLNQLKERKDRNKFLEYNEGAENGNQSLLMDYIDYFQKSTENSATEEYQKFLNVLKEEMTQTDAKSASEDNKTRKFSVQMPQVKIPYDDTYLCTAIDISSNETKTLYITQFIPHAQQSVAHHLLLYACRTPGSDAAAWNCGGPMAETDNPETKLPHATICADGEIETILWAWAKGAPRLELPHGVGFEVGPSTGLNFLVFNAHFKSKTVANENNSVYNTGVTVSATTEQQPKVAGIYLSMSMLGSVPPHKKKNFDIICRVHTHALGFRVSGYKVSTGIVDRWIEIGNENPQHPEAFYPVKDKFLSISNGDWLASRCEMFNFRNRTTNIGMKHTDEMCNFYIMYWKHRDKNSAKVKTMMCKNGFPWTHWRNKFNNLPF